MFRLVTRLHACEPEIKTFSAQSTASVKIRFTQRDRKRSLPVMLPDLETVIVELQLGKSIQEGVLKIWLTGLREHNGSSAARWNDDMRSWTRHISAPPATDCVGVNELPHARTRIC